LQESASAPEQEKPPAFSVSRAAWKLMVSGENYGRLIKLAIPAMAA